VAFLLNRYIQLQRASSARKKQKPMSIFLFMVGGVNVGTPEIMIVLLALFVVFLVVRNIVYQPKE